MNDIDVLVLPQSGSGARSRLRFSQYFPLLREQGFRITDAARTASASTSAHGTPLSAAEFVRRLHGLGRSGRFDLIWIDEECLPGLPASVELGMLSADVPLVLDYGEGAFERYHGHGSALVRRMLGGKFGAVMQRADLALAGSGYLATRAREAGCKRVEQLGTAVDAERYRPRMSCGQASPVLGWLGSPHTADDLRGLSPALDRLKAHHSFRAVAVGARPDQVEGTCFECLPSTEDAELQALEIIDIGLVPPAESASEQGRVGHRALQFMASGLPVIATPVGAHRDIISNAVHGRLAGSEMEWESALQTLLPDPSTRARMGAAGRQRVESKYSLQAQALRLGEMLRAVAAQSARGGNARTVH